MDGKFMPRTGKHKRDAISLLVQFICACSINCNRVWFLVRRRGYVIYNSLAWKSRESDVNLFWVVIMRSCMSEAKREKEECYRERSLHSRNSCSTLSGWMPLQGHNTCDSHEKGNSRTKSCFQLSYSAVHLIILGTFQEQPIISVPLIMPYCTTFSTTMSCHPLLIMLGSSRRVVVDDRGNFIMRVRWVQ